MNVYLNNITGLDDAMVSMLMSKRSWTNEQEQDIRNLVAQNTDRNGFFLKSDVKDPHIIRLMNNLIKYGVHQGHTTLLRFIDLSFTVEGLHRAGQDDWDAHASRMDNRIVRASTRLGSFKEGEISAYYEDKIKFPGEVFKQLFGVDMPDSYVDRETGKLFVKTEYGYIREDLRDIQDVKRGLYPESIPSNFIFKVQYPELCHIIQFRDNTGHAHPEVQLLAEVIKELVLQQNKWLGENLTKLKMQPKEI
jgi:hypothetical protein